MSEPDLVTVIIPAFNAARTIDETIRSVRSQTHRRLEILVVDDGSVDATAQIVRSHAAEDQRIRLIQQSNSGVAAARNRAIAEATSDYVAPIDADDLWRPDKIEKQLARLHRDGETVALVYAWSAFIDENSRIVAAVPGPTHTGNVVGEIFGGNFPGNGSTVLMRKAAVIDAGGYDASLRARSAQGVEDWQLYFRIATRHEFSVVPEYLTGYRKTAAGMSADLLQMLRSRDLLAEEMCNRYPEYTAEIRAARLFFLGYLYHRALSNRQGIGTLMIAALLIRQNPLMGAKAAFFYSRPRTSSARMVATNAVDRAGPGWEAATRSAPVSGRIARGLQPELTHEAARSQPPGASSDNGGDCKGAAAILFGARMAAAVAGHFGTGGILCREPRY